ncbi:MAG TPA: TetR family transcriptional regulator [Candidatus Janibacter merdipullorum]|nr:TetR family transcriptional regulator [Candidatus Janibacter merdipullorum]
MEDTPVRDARRPGRGQQARHRLLEAAVAQLADVGMRGLTHRRVEQRAGLAQGSAKYYFGPLDALVEAVLTHLLTEELPLVLEVSPEERADAMAKGETEALLTRARAVVEAVSARPDRVRARFILYLHAAGDPHLEHLVGEARDVMVARIAESLPGPAAEVGARFVCALVDGMLLDQLSAPSEVVEAHAARFVLAAGAAGAQLARGGPGE